MSLATELDKEIQNGQNGKVGVIPVAYDRVQDYIDIAKNTYYVVVGEAGSGKSTLVQDLFIVNPIRWYLQNKNDDIKLSIIYFGMERKMYQYTARWISRLIFENTGRHIAPKRILGRKRDDALTEEEYLLVQKYYKVLDEWEQDDVLIAHQGSKNPSGISLYLEAFARKYGEIHEKDKTDKSIDNILETRTYTPNHPNHIVLVITDHIGILAPERNTDNKAKTAIDKFSRCMREARDLYGFSPVIVQQMNRNISDVQRHKLGDLTPKLSDMADSSSSSQDADVIVCMLDPYRHVVKDDRGRYGKDDHYDMDKLRDKWWRTYYRTLYILKNSFEASGQKFQMGLQPVQGIMKTLPPNNAIPDNIYEEVTTGRYFLPTEIEREEKQIMHKAFSGFGDRQRIMNEVKATTV